MASSHQIGSRKNCSECNNCNPPPTSTVHYFVAHLSTLPCKVLGTRQIACHLIMTPHSK
ncbi:hypothetical protein JYU34_014971 [Plutella xylostella]|uniref:Uncharacterized protein n=1 Tax=Plutella xylostella TaxID=51655 RepID=A0ABQ7Q648_PLUXY|nr:hypothetical protein JYU34_014971 [Plutella xylostella]